MVTTHEAAAPAARSTRLPHLRDIVKRVALSLLAAVVAPAVLFATVLVLVNVTAAMIAALGWTAGVVAWRAATGRCVSVLLLLTGGIMTVKTGITLATGNTFIYFVQPVFVDLVVALLFLGSLWSARPLVARLAPDFCPMDSELAAHPEIRRLLHRLTLMWGLVILVKGSVTLWLLLSLSTVDFVLVKSGAIMTLTVTAVAATIVWATAVGRREGLLGLPQGSRTPAPW
ncbi:VC0807 family protein [Aeromicrobium stalagmiti]|uniref:VC0807 family protein n=1 Tax=Aeromicrobium stalagmiti TaxID=2738988 RepID=UPI0015680757|nr:VC0807 family protein [Aeromicrobium stalagmiti]NRQ49184.1 septation protein IspZ [Aeromicrobium stalagmiti]